MGAGWKRNGRVESCLRASASPQEISRNNTVFLYCVGWGWFSPQTKAEDRLRIYRGPLYTHARYGVTRPRYRGCPVKDVRLVLLATAFHLLCTRVHLLRRLPLLLIPPLHVLFRDFAVFFARFKRRLLLRISFRFVISHPGAAQLHLPGSHCGSWQSDTFSPTSGLGRGAERFSDQIVVSCLPPSN